MALTTAVVAASMVAGSMVVGERHWEAGDVIKSPDAIGIRKC